jgi:hypothetical protein
MVENTVLGIDIGVKTLGLCVISSEKREEVNYYKILLWDSFDCLLDYNKTCSGIKKDGNLCGKKCSYTNKIEYTCKTHNKNCPIKYKAKKLKEYKLQDLCKAVIKKLNEIFENFPEIFKLIDIVNIELQPSFSPRMKAISNVIFGKIVEYYIESDNVNINFVRASEKLKIYDGPELKCSLKSNYSKRKWLSIEHIKYFIENKLCEEQKNIWIEKIDKTKYKKIDDITDAACYCLVSLIQKRKKVYKKKSII